MGANMEKVELVIAALQQRIGELVSNYETQIAVLRAELTQLNEASNKIKEDLNKE
jgi:flagellar capping protein FliD